MAYAPAGYLSINEAADMLDTTPWVVEELIYADQLRGVTFVDAASVKNLKETA